MASMPELGSKISLISKSDIRYEGQLYTVDPNECTIALANGKFFFLLSHLTYVYIYHQKKIIEGLQQNNFFSTASWNRLSFFFNLIGFDGSKC